MFKPTDKELGPAKMDIHIFRNFPSVRFSVITAIIALADIHVEFFGDSPVPGEDMKYWDGIGFILFVPIWLPKLYLLHFIEFIWHTQIMGIGSKVSEITLAILSGLGDIVICFLYVLLFRLLLHSWRLLRKRVV